MKRLLLLLYILFTLAQTFAAEGPEIYVQLGHGDEVYAVTYSPDGKYVVTGSRDKTIKLWEVESGRLVRTFIGHSHFVKTVTFSPDGKLIASGNITGEVKLWERESGRELKSFAGFNNEVVQVLFTPDGKQLVASSTNDTKTRLWDIASGKEVRTFDNKYSFRGLALSPDGKRLVTVGNLLRVFDFESGRELRAIKGAISRRVSFSADGKLLLTGGEGLKLVEVESGKVLKSYLKKTVLASAYSPDGLLGASTRYDGVISLWDLKSGEVLRELKGHLDDVYALNFSPDGKYLISAGKDFTARIWEVESGKMVKSFKGSSYSINSLTFSQDGDYLYTGAGDSMIRRWELIRGSQDGILKGHSDLVKSLAFIPGEPRLLTLSADRKMLVWDTESLKQAGVVRDDFYNTGSLLIHPSGRYVLAARDLMYPSLYDIESGSKVRTYSGVSHLSKPVYNAQGSYDYVPADYIVQGASFSPDGRYIVCSTNDGALKIWDIKQERELFSVNGHKGESFAALWSPDGSHIFSSSADREVKMWEFREEVGFLKELKSFSSHYSSIMALSGDGRFLASGGFDGTLKVWNVETGKELFQVGAHKSTVRALSFSPDGRFIATGSWDTTTKLWDALSGEEVAMMVSFSTGEWVIVTPEGYYNASPEGAKELNVRLGNRVYSIDNYAEKFFRPDLVRLALKGKKLDNMLGLGAILPAPTISIVDVKKLDSEHAEVTVNIEDNGGGVGDIRLYLNQSAILLDNKRGLKKKDGGSRGITRTYKIRLVDGLNRIRLLAFNSDNSMQSNAAHYELETKVVQREKPNLHALVIGINSYKNPILELEYAVPDAKLFADVLKRVSKPLFNEINIKLLTTMEETGRENIIKHLESYNDLAPSDLFIFYVASHGTAADGNYFLITSNVGATSTKKLEETAINQNSLKELMANIPTTKKLIIIDTCNSQALGDALQMAFLTRGLSEDTAIKVLSRAVGVTILSASSTTQEALEGYEGHGLFTYVLTQGLTGKADYDKDGFIKTFELADYIDNNVPLLAEEIFEQIQYPIVSPGGQGFPIGKVE